MAAPSLAQLLKTMVDNGASDLHITRGSPPQIRMDGNLVKLKTDPLTADDTKAICYSILSSAQKATFEEHNELDFSFGIVGLARFRGNVFVQQQAVAGAFRLIPFKIRNFDELGLPKIVSELVKKPRGLILVTGPTGSGKSTTLASMIDKVNEDEHGHIVTIEDPVEFLHQHKNCVVNQREVGSDTHSFKKALKSILRQDPDCVLIGELRDLETIEAALTIAETGHLAFGTLHTNGAVQTINRIVDVFPSYQQPQIRAQLSFVLEGVLSQSLIPKIGGGRALVLEVMVPTPAIRNLIREDKVHQIYSQMQLGQTKYGMQTANQCLVGHVQRKWITLDQAIEYSSDPDELRNMIAAGKKGLMPVFIWEGRTRAGEMRKGTMEAEQESDIGNRLRALGITLSKARKQPKQINLKISFGSGVSEKDLVVFTRQFATMIDAGLPIVQCLDILSTQSPNKIFGTVLAEVKASVEGGSTLSDALRRKPKVFNELYVNLVQAGEVGGILDSILARLATYIEKASKLKSQVKGAMVYPISILCVALMVVVLILWKVIPVFEKMFKDFGGGALPKPTQIVIDLSNGFLAHFWVITAGILGIIFGVPAILRTKKGRATFDKYILKTPIIGNVLRKVAVARFTRTLGTLLASGVAILDAMEIVAKTAGNVTIHDALMYTREKISEGKNMVDPLMETKIFPPMVVQMIGVGEQTGAMDTMLQKIADFYEDEVDVAVNAMTKLMEPLMMVFLGGIVGGLIIAMYLPIFEMAGNIKSG